MNPLKIAFVISLVAFSTFGQQLSSAITPGEFGPIFRAGFTTTQALGRQGLRFTETRGDWVLKIETDRSQSIRASYINVKSGVADSECIVVGDSIYERSRKGQWTVRSRAEYNSAEAVRSEGMKKALAAKDTETYRRLSSSGPSRATVSATRLQIFSSFGILMDFTNDNVGDKVITSQGTGAHNGQAVRLYKFTGISTKFSPASTGPDSVRKLVIEIDYSFDEKTGALVKAQTKHSWVYDAKTVTYIDLYEWAPDPEIEIKSVSQTYR